MRTKHFKHSKLHLNMLEQIINFNNAFLEDVIRKSYGMPEELKLIIELQIHANETALELAADEDKKTKGYLLNNLNEKLN